MQTPNFEIPTEMRDFAEKSVEQARKAFLDVVDFVVAQSRNDPNAVYAGSVPYLMLAGNLVAGWQMGRALPKDEILALYLKQTFYGGFAYGVEAAARTYFAARDGLILTGPTGTNVMDVRAILIG